MAISSTLVDRVKIFAESSGSGPFVLGNAVPAFRGAEALIDGLTYSYAVESGADYEAGQGVYVEAVNQLIRAPTISSANGAPVSFPANVSINFTALAADLLTRLEGSGTVTSVSGSGGTTGLTLTGGPIEIAGVLTLGGVLGVASGGTAGTTAAEARTGIGLGNVDNTSDANKPISTATQVALDGKASADFLQSGTGAIPEVLQNAIRRGVGATPFQFGAVGNGVTDDGPALQLWLDRGGFLRLPDGVSFSTEQLLFLTKPNTVVVGGGEVLIPFRIVGTAPDGSTAGVITVIAEGCTIDGVKVSNPSQERLSTGTVCTGISVCANNTRIRNCTVLDFEYGITLSPFGEFYDWWVDSCFVRVNGCGQLTPDNEDRGDGITGWGARMHITNNRVAALAGTQARCGIFVEGLSVYAVVTSGLDFNTTAIISGNQVGVADQTYPLANPSVGNFRKGIDCEQVDRCEISDNIVRSCAWFGIQVAGDCDDVGVHDNIVYCDTPAGDTNGASWTSSKAAIHYYPNGATNAINVRFSNNQIHLITAQSRAFLARGLTTSVARNLLVDGNQVYADVDMGAIEAFTALDFAAGTQVHFKKNVINGAFARGILAISCPLVLVTGGEFIGQDDGVSLQTVTKAIVRGAAFLNLGNGIETVTVGTAIVEDNIFDTMSIRCIVNAGVTALMAKGNHCREGGGLVGDFGTLTTLRWLENTGFAFLTGSATYDPASVAAGANGGVSGNITVTGALAGDGVKASFSQLTPGIVPIGSPSAANTDIGGFSNITASPVDLASGTFTVANERG